jgi:hypothetical protein
MKQGGFLHKERAKRRYQQLYAEIQQQVWDIYGAADRSDFCRQMADFQLWAGQHLTGPALEAVNKLCAKADAFALAFDHPTAFRASRESTSRHLPFMVSSLLTG